MLDAPQCADCGHLFRTHFALTRRKSGACPPPRARPGFAPRLSVPPPPLFCCFGRIFSLVGVSLGVLSLVRIGGNPVLKGTRLAWTVRSALAFFWFLAALLSAGGRRPEN